jgi:hypothetical protein
MKMPMIPSGIKPATFCLVTQCLNQLRQSVPRDLLINVNVFIDPSETILTLKDEQQAAVLKHHSVPRCKHFSSRL